MSQMDSLPSIVHLVYPECEYETLKVPQYILPTMEYVALGALVHDHSSKLASA